MRILDKSSHKWIFLAAMFSSAGAMTLACSSDPATTTTPTTPTTHSDASSGGDSATSDGGATGQDSSSTGNDGSSGGDAGGSADCGTAATLHPDTDGGIYCPFSAVDGGKNIFCADTEQCCESAKGGAASSCVAKGSACPSTNDTVWECESPANCPSGQVCCAAGSTAAVTIGDDTCGPYLSKFSKTHCAASCTATELTVCEKQSECTTGTCTAVKPKANAIGVCR